MSRTARAGLLLLPLGPLCVALLRYLLPYRTTDDSLAMVRAVAAHPTRESVALWLGLVAVLTLIPGLVSVFAALPASRVKYAAIGLCVPGYLCLGALLGEDQILWAGAHNHTSPRVTAALLDALHPSVGIATAIFVVGHIVGTVLLGVALLRTRRFPAWAALGGHCVPAVALRGRDRAGQPRPRHVRLGPHRGRAGRRGGGAAGALPAGRPGESVTAVASAAVAAS